MHVKELLALDNFRAARLPILLVYLAMHRLLWLAAVSLLLSKASSLQPSLVAPRRPAAVSCRPGVVTMGRKFENNKLKMAKTALAYAKKVPSPRTQTVLQHTRSSAHSRSRSRRRPTWARRS